VLETAFGWRSTFYLLIVVGVLLAFMIFTLLPETLRIRAAEPVSPGSILRSFRVLLKSRSYLAYAAISVTTYAGLFAWISGASFVLQGLFGLDAFVFGLAFAAASAGYMVGAMTAARIVGKLGLDSTIGIGAAVQAFGGICMIAVVASGHASAFTLVTTVAIYLGGMGLVLPQAAAGALTRFPERAGAASSLVGFVQQSGAAIVGALVGLALGTSAWPLALAIAIVGVLVLVIWTLTRDVRARGV
jgi:DHA1 family bicyclomycin/chloramphenicol resistance-like MFS transporter